VHAAAATRLSKVIFEETFPYESGLKMADVVDVLKCRAPPPTFCSVEKKTSRHTIDTTAVTHGHIPACTEKRQEAVSNVDTHTHEYSN